MIERGWIMMKPQNVQIVLEEKIKYIIHMYTSKLPPVLDPTKLIKEINSRLTEHESSFKAIEKKLDINLFISFLLDMVLHSINLPKVVFAQLRNWRGTTPFLRKRTYN